MDEAYYWKQISKHRFPQNRLRELLVSAENHRDSVTTLPNPYGPEEMTIERAKKYCFFFGTEDATHGEINVFGPFGSTATLFSIIHNLKTYPITTYGEIFFQYADAYHTVEMIAFLEKQKGRLDKGEDITNQGEIERFAQYDDEGANSASEVENKNASLSIDNNIEQLKLTHPQIAILYHITKCPLTKNNANDIARKYGQTSGQKLLDTYKELTSNLTRTAKSRNRVKDYECILPLIPEKHKDLYNKELSEARANNEK